MADTSPAALAVQLLAILGRDKDRLTRIDDYLHGRHDDPYMPAMADDEYRLLARRAVSNWMPLLVNTPAQALYVDGYRAGDDANKGAATDLSSPQWEHWQRSRLDARQSAVYKGALTYGHAFTLTERVAGKVLTKGLSPLRTSALYEDAANDDTPYAALSVTAWPKDGKPGRARMWDARFEYAVTFKALGDSEGVRATRGKRHGSSECPVTRFAAAVDLEGRTIGVIEVMIPLQNRINQTIFDLLVAQTYASVKVRTATGMAPPVQRDPDTGEIVYDEQGNPIPLPINHNAKRFLFAEDPDVRFGSLDETPLGGFIDSIDMSIRHLSAIAQVPPHHLLGQIANLSAEALQAAETALSRKIQEFRTLFGEAWERVFRLAAELEGSGAADDFKGEVLWRDMEQRSLAQAADALGKLREQLGIPAKGLWKRVPQVTQTELDEWDDLADEEDSVKQLASALTRATPEPVTADEVPAAA
ncbi:phage portal protein [Actinacidiphila glaucinigra]|uniref:Phage portal protein, SPP1 Gp6-like n=1 Tax=Actinacidiphila glaucinigra TaxID=235986 RepID=A0A239F256_9ACTN|nr:phage portal protein [Actinacidiphila glaucinigra]SNS50232.1 Phage portal protein, SPP1 Gp6-like [Actinacidiphila glaucinigra]